MTPAEISAMLKKAKGEIKEKGKTIKPAPGNNRYILLPATPTGKFDGGFYHAFGQHFVKDAAGAVQAVAVCQNETFGKPCSVCEGLAHAMASVRDDATTALLTQAKAGKRFLLNVLALDSENPKDPQILELSGQAFNGLLTSMEEWGSEMMAIGEVRGFTVNREGKGLNTRYTTGVSGKKENVPASVYTRVANIFDYVNRESEQSRNQALTHLRSVAGVLPAPSAPSAGGAPRASRTFDESDGYAAAGRAASKEDGPSIDDELDALMLDDDVPQF